MSDSGESNVTKHETIDERLLNRVIFFTDAVFAIVMTLMILDLRPPAFASVAGNDAALQSMAGHFFALVMSFVVIGVFWIAHLATTRRLRHFDWPTAVANLAFMFPVCLIPFATAWWGRDLNAPFPWGMYCGVMLASSLANLALVLTVSRDGGRLMGGCTPRERLYRAARAASPGVAFGLGIVLLLFHRLHWAQFSFVLIPLQIALYARFLKPAAASSPA
ncbi:TMEM175 family protein [Phenylobacterium sp.]|uniref:TMEM175 family protein n=1 Tax=Phenylobacterium sp. TaxID=1871053 RepID=UPI002BFCC1FC|nr:TMEM175 family protein [Phenylobacterium sp.]HLZ77614.1 TMEM175 family protein [Phenylobacterium sp.]